MKLKKLAEYVAEMEAELAPGSETSLLTGFVSDYGFVSEARESNKEIDDAEMQLWQDAYAKYQELEAAGEDFNINDCF